MYLAVKKPDPVLSSMYIRQRIYYDNKQREIHDGNKITTATDLYGKVFCGIRQNLQTGTALYRPASP
jgi:hypothetical protein